MDTDYQLWGNLKHSMDDVELGKKPIDGDEATVSQHQEQQQGLPDEQPQRHQKNKTLRCPPRYFQSPTGILKLVEMILCLVTFACSLGGHWSSKGGGFVEFVSMAAFTSSAVWLMMHLVDAVPRCLLAKPWEFVSCVVVAALFFVSAILSAVYTQALNKGAVAAVSFFSFANVAVYGMVDAYFQVYEWRTYTSMAAAVQRSAAASNSAQPLHTNL